MSSSLAFVVCEIDIFLQVQEVELILMMDLTWTGLFLCVSVLCDLNDVGM